VSAGHLQPKDGLLAGLVQRLAATRRSRLHSSPRALVTTVVSRVVLRRVRNCRSYYYYYYYYYYHSFSYAESAQSYLEVRNLHFNQAEVV